MAALGAPMATAIEVPRLWKFPAMIRSQAEVRRTIAEIEAASAPMPTPEPPTEPAANA